MEACPIDGIILTKLDGTAKGGVVLSIKQSLNIPVRYIGVGERVDDLQKFNAEGFAEALIFITVNSFNIRGRNSNLLRFYLLI